MGFRIKALKVQVSPAAHSRPWRQADRTSARLNHKKLKTLSRAESNRERPVSTKPPKVKFTFCRGVVAATKIPLVFSWALRKRRREMWNSRSGGAFPMPSGAASSKQLPCILPTTLQGSFSKKCRPWENRWFPQNPQAPVVSQKDGGTSVAPSSEFRRQDKLWQELVACAKATAGASSVYLGVLEQGEEAGAPGLGGEEWLGLRSRVPCLRGSLFRGSTEIDMYVFCVFHVSCKIRLTTIREAFCVMLQ